KFNNSLYWSQRRHRRCNHLLRPGISAGQNRVPMAILLLLPLDPPAGVVRFRALDSFPNHRRLRAKDRNQLGFILRAFGRRRGRPRWLGNLPEAESSGRSQSRSGAFVITGGEDTSAVHRFQVVLKRSTLSSRDAQTSRDLTSTR